MAKSSYRVRRWLRNAKDWRNYIVYLGQARKTSGSSRVYVGLKLSAGNTLYPTDVSNTPEWFVEDDFELQLSGGDTIEFIWNTDHWETSEEFDTETGTANLIQGANEALARWTDAEVTGYWRRGYAVGNYVEGNP